MDLIVSNVFLLMFELVNIQIVGAPVVLGIWGEGLIIFRELGCTAYYFRGAGEQAHTFGDLGSTTKK